MRLRSKLTIMGLAALAGFIVSRPDLRNEIAYMLEDYKLRFLDALEQGKNESIRKELELEKELKESSEPSS